jgi:O-methyltransferase involved in polyketide biosynthesis
MKEGTPSFTAEMDAVVRWVQTEKPERQRLCYDPMAKGFVSPTSRLLGAFAPIARIALWYMDRQHPWFQDCVPARTRYIEHT